MIFLMTNSIPRYVEKSDVFRYTLAMTKRSFARASFFCAFVILFASCAVDKKTTQQEIRAHRNNMLTYQALMLQQQSQREAVAKYVESLSEISRISQLFLANVNGSEYFSPLEYENDVGIVPGGYIFFSYNIADSPEKIISFTDKIADYCASHQQVMPYLAIDQEGGAVNRLRGITSVLPSNSRVAQLFTPAQAQALYACQAEQLHALGFTMNIAPVAEVCMESNKSFLDGRSYGSAEQVVSYSAAAIVSCQKNEVGTVVKHFPGNTNVDPHTGLPEISLSQEEIDKQIIEPFTKVISFLPDAVLMSHARTASYDSKNPACLSSFWVTDMLRGKMKYSGLVLSDDIFMAALEKNGFPADKAAVKAIEAGVDVIMMSEKQFVPTARVLLAHARKNQQFAQRLFESEQRVVWYKIKCGILALTMSSDGAYTVVERSREDRFGDTQQRQSSFNNAFSQGLQWYDDAIASDAKRQKINTMLHVEGDNGK